MTTTALRELAYAALQAQLATALPDLPVERNRRAEVDFEAGEAPRLVLRDGAQDPADDQAAGQTNYTMQALLEGYTTAASDDTLGAAVNELYRRVAAALFGQAIALPGGLDIWPLEGRLEVDFAMAPQADMPCAAFFLQLAFDLAAPTGAPSATT